MEKEKDLLELLYELKETQTRKEDKQLDAAIYALKNGCTDSYAFKILNGEINIE